MDQYIFGIVLLLLGGSANTLSHLNLAILETFNGDLKAAHDVINYEWGMFYPSIYVFSFWQAYNKAFTINSLLDGEQPKKNYLSGFCVGLVLAPPFS
jgi:hypothetical protein